MDSLRIMLVFIVLLVLFLVASLYWFYRKIHQLQKHYTQLVEFSQENEAFVSKPIQDQRFFVEGKEPGKQQKK